MRIHVLAMALLPMVVMASAEAKGNRSGTLSRQQRIERLRRLEDAAWNPVLNLPPPPAPPSTPQPTVVFYPAWSASASPVTPSTPATASLPAAPSPINPPEMMGTDFATSPEIVYNDMANEYLNGTLNDNLNAEANYDLNADLNAAYAQGWQNALNTMGDMENPSYITNYKDYYDPDSYDPYGGVYTFSPYTFYPQPQWGR